MITVYYEEYHNDYIRYNHVKRFESLKELEDWIFNQMQADYSASWAMSVPTPEAAKRINGGYPWEISFRPVFRGPDYWIHMIENDEGIIFSDGRRTSNQRHWNDEVKKWLVNFEHRRKQPKFNFV